MRKLFLLGFVGCVVVSCQSGVPVLAEVKKDVVMAKPVLVASNSIANYYDRDGDGKVEEWRRAETTYYDRNGDGLVDRKVVGFGIQSHGWRQIDDTDFDGFFDQEMEERMDGGMHPVRKLRQPVPRFPALR